MARQQSESCSPPIELHLSAGQGSAFHPLSLVNRRLGVRVPSPALTPDLALPAEAAAALRQHWSLPDGPVKHLAATAKSHGIVLAVRPLQEIDDVDAFSVVILERPIIITTPRRTENVFKHRFSVAHEIGHLLLHGDVGEPTAAVEKEADEFASCFPYSGAAMDAALPQRLDLATLDRLGRQWGVAPTSLVRRMVERGRTTESSARRAYQRLSTVDDANADPTSAYPGELPTLLNRAAQLAGDHGAGVHALAEALKLNPAQVRDLLGDTDERPMLRLVGDEG